MSDVGFHKIRSLKMTTGFLDGVELDFDDSLNCVIGGRGTGKTTVLEALRYALDRMPDPNLDKERYQAIEKLLANNFGGGSARVEIETAEGAVYTVVRGIGEAPLVTNDEGNPVDINIGKDIVFGVDIYSQNQIEDIANDSFFQLQLIDRFIHSEIEDAERAIRETTRDLDANAAEIMETRKVVDDLIEATRELPDVNEKIRGFDKSDAGGSELVRKEHERKSLRERERQLLEDVRALFDEGIDGIEGVVQYFEQVDDAFGVDLTASANREIVESVQRRTRDTIGKVALLLEKANQELTAALSDLTGDEAQLNEQQGRQEKKYRDLLDSYEQERAKGAERTQLEKRQADLQAKEKS